MVAYSVVEAYVDNMITSWLPIVRLMLK